MCYLYLNYFAIIVLVFTLDGCLSQSGFRQEAARVTHVNPKYVQNISIFTYRLKRNAPYLTSVNGTTLKGWGSNLTLSLEYNNMKVASESFMLEGKVCELFNLKWATDFVVNFTDIPLRCPINAGTYHASGFELPPKNFPLPFHDGDYHVRLAFVVTGTKEKILEFQLNLRFQKKKINSAK